ncbi:DUF7507 domain-containing protein [Glaciibacter flavus]|uniref:DUF7507 domain-containing protein n=1 Tax=Orlajensenia flava TaxID=2565934 RepID=UPI003B00B2C7
MRGKRRARAAIAAVVSTLLVASGLVVGLAVPASADPPAGGSTVVTETFSGATVPDPAWKALGDTCLTGTAAGARPPVGAAQIRNCDLHQMGAVPLRGTLPGYLQLTDRAGNRAGDILYNKPIPATAGVSLSFEQYQYDGNGADGIGFFLVDGATDLTDTGGLGGSLGYAQRNGEPGITGGYLGVGLDAYGNFWDDGENRGNGCPADQRSPSTNNGPIAPNVVSLRGPGSGVVGYCLIGPTVGGPTSPAGATTPYPVTNPNKPGTTLNGGQGTLRGGTLAASQRTINIQVTPLPNPRVIVQIQYVTDGPWITELNAAAPPNTPSTYKFGLSASTGGSNDIHLVRAAQVRTINPLPDLQLEKQVDRSGTPLPAIITAGTVIPYQYTVTNVGAPVDTLSITDDKIPTAAIRCDSTTLSTAPAQGSTTVCRGTYTVTAADVAIQRVDNVATAHAKVAPGGLDVASPPSAVTVPLLSTLTIAKQVTTPAPYAVGANIAYQYTLTNTGGSILSNFLVTDDRIPSSGIICATGTLNPGQSTICVGSHIIQPGQLNAAGYLVNTASAAATSTIGQKVQTANVSVSVPVAVDVGVTKTVDVISPVVGSDVTFTITATNYGPSAATGVVITDQVPDGDPVGSVVYRSSSTTGGTYTASTGAWAIPALAVGQSFVLTIVATVNTGNPFTNSASRTRTDQPDTNPNNDTASVTLNPITPTADLAVTKSVDQPSIPVGATAIFTVTVQNTGPFAANNVAVTDQIPSALGYVGCASPCDGTYDPAAGIWTIGALAVGAIATRTFVVTGLTTGNFTNLAATTGASTPPDPNPSNNSDFATLNVRPPVADLAVVKTPFPQSAVVGDTITYQLTASNLGPDAAPGVFVTDVWPAGVKVVSVLPADKITADGTSWNVGLLNPGQTASATITALLTDSGTQVNTATISSSVVIDPNPSNNSSSGTVTSAQPTLDIGVTKSVLAVRDGVPVTEVPVGQDVVFTVTATNFPDPGSSVTATNLVFGEPLPTEGLQFVSATTGGAGTGAAYDATTGRWTIASLDANGTATLTVRATVIKRGNWTNTVSLISLTQTDRDPSNNSASVVVVGVIRTDLQIVKSVNPTVGQPGQDVVYSVVVTNNGPNDATGVEAFDSNLIPADLVDVTTSPGTSFDIATRIWTIGNLASGASVALQVTVLLDQRYGWFRNVVVVNSSTPDPDTTNNVSYADLFIPAADIAVTKVVDKPAVFVGDPVTFTIGVSNLGPDPATAVSVKDLLPPEFTFASATPSVGTYDASSGVWTIGDLDPAKLPAPAAGTLQLSIVATANAPGRVTNTAISDRASQFPFDPVPANNTAQAEVQIDALPAQLTITKAVSQASVPVGSAVTYTIVVGNLGPAAAANVVHTDSFPSGVRPTAVRGTGCAIAGRDVTCAIGTLGVNGTSTIEVDAIVDDVGTFVNTASVTTSTPPVTPGVVEASATVTGVTVPEPPDAGGGGGGLAHSGVDPSLPVGSALALVLLGLVLMSLRRRRLDP